MFPIFPPWVILQPGLHCVMKLFRKGNLELFIDSPDSFDWIRNNVLESDMDNARVWFREFQSRFRIRFDPFDLRFKKCWVMGGRVDSTCCHGVHRGDRRDTFKGISVEHDHIGLWKYLLNFGKLRQHVFFFIEKNSINQKKKPSSSLPIHIHGSEP